MLSSRPDQSGQGRRQYLKLKLKGERTKSAQRIAISATSGHAITHASTAQTHQDAEVQGVDTAEVAAAAEEAAEAEVAETAEDEAVAEEATETGTAATSSASSATRRGTMRENAGTTPTTTTTKIRSRACN